MQEEKKPPKNEKKKKHMRERKRDNLMCYVQLPCYIHYTII